MSFLQEEVSRERLRQLQEVYGSLCWWRRGCPTDREDKSTRKVGEGNRNAKRTG